MTAEMGSRAIWIFLVAALAGLVIAGIYVPTGGAWHLGMRLAAGLAAGSIALALIGRLLSRQWLDLIEDELLPAGASLVLLPFFAIPALFLPVPAPFAEAVATPQRAFWFATEAVLVRLGLFIAGGLVAVWAMATLKGARLRVAAVGLPLFAALFAFVTIDWVMLRVPVWWTALIPIAFMVNQLTGALALAFVYHLVQGEKGEERQFASLASALLSLGLLDLWIGYVQFLIAWYGNLPEAAQWYFARMDSVFLVIAALVFCVAGVALLALNRTRKTMLCAAVSLLAGYLGYNLWLAGGVGWSELPFFAGLLFLWLAWLAAAARWYDARRQDGSGSKAA